MFFGLWARYGVGLCLGLETSGTVLQSANYDSDRPLSPSPARGWPRRNRRLRRLRLILSYCGAMCGRSRNERKIPNHPWTIRENGIIASSDAASLRRDVR
jgi:hypothetical protein